MLHWLDMLGTTSEKLSDKIVRHLAGHPGATARELQRALRIGIRVPTIQAVHQELRKLLRLKVAVRSHERYSLRLGWLLPLSRMCEQALQNATSEAIDLYLLRGARKSQRWEFLSPERLVRFWTELCLRLLAQSKDGLMCEFAEHVWFHLVATEEMQFLGAMKLEAYKYLLVSSGDTLLDRSYARYLQSPNFHFSTGFSPFPAKRGDYFTVIGDYIIRAQVAPKTRKTIASLYAKTKSIEPLLMGELYSILNQRGRMVLTLRHDPKTAQLLRRQFLSFFGVSISI